MCLNISHFIACCLCMFINPTVIWRMLTHKNRERTMVSVYFWLHKSLTTVFWLQCNFRQESNKMKITNKGSDYHKRLLPVRTACSSTQQIGQDLSHSSQTLLCVQWAYLLTVLLDSEPFSFFPPLILHLQTVHVKNDCSVLNLCGAKKAENLTGARLSQCTGILMPDKGLRLAEAKL